MVLPDMLSIVQDQDQHLTHLQQRIQVLHTAAGAAQPAMSTAVMGEAAGVPLSRYHVSIAQQH